MNCLLCVCLCVGWSLQKHAVGAASTERDLEGFCDALNRPERRKHGVFSSVARHPSVPSERIYHSTLAQWPRATVSHLRLTIQILLHFAQKLLCGDS